MNLPKVGDRIELLEMPNDPDPIHRGARGTVRSVHELTFCKSTQICVAWDEKRSLSLVVPPDRYRIIERVMG